MTKTHRPSKSRLYWFATVLLFASLALIGAASDAARGGGASDSPPTRLSVRGQGNATQTGRIVERSTTKGDRRGCVTSDSLGEGVPRPIYVTAERSLRFVVSLPRKQRPKRLAARVWRKREGGMLVGPSDDVPFDLVRKGDGKRRWTMRLRDSLPSGSKYYLRTYAEWRDERCNAKEYTYTQFFLRSRAAN